MASRLHRYAIKAKSAILAGLCTLLSISAAASGATDISENTFKHAQPDLSWNPEPFAPAVNKDARYIDYSNGQDNNPGTREQPWKHHPWDPNATSRPAKSKGIVTYYFKQGVVYHGSLVAAESGSPNKPIRLTIDPDWGAGDAVLAGSQRIQGNWQICDNQENELLPEVSRGRTWCNYTTLEHTPQSLFTSHEEELSRIRLARTPNWTISNPYDPRSEWFEIQDSLLEVTLSVQATDGFTVGDSVYPGHSQRSAGRISHIEPDKITLEIQPPEYRHYKPGARLSNGRSDTLIEEPSENQPLGHLLIDTDNLTESSPSFYKGATLWIEPRRIPIPVTTSVVNYDPTQSAINARFSMGPEAGPVKRSRYFLEGLPQFLDAPGEYAFQRVNPSSIRLYLRLPADQDPNETIIEAARYNTLLHIEDQSHIELSGLRFRSTNQVEPGKAESIEAPIHASAIQIRGSSSDIEIHHCKFDYLPAGVVAYPADTGKRSTLDYIIIRDSEFSHIDGSAIALGNGHRREKFAKTSSRLIHVDILRNRLSDIGLLALGQRGALGVYGDAILVHGGEVVEIAHNHINYVGGPGIQLALGSEYSRGHVDRPFLRGLIHHNKVIDSLLSSYDFGGISVWTGGPVYIFNNISGNPVGYLHTSPRDDPELNSLQRTSYGIGIYLDGVYKAYVFNNIAWGIANDLSQPIYNAAAFNEATGFMHTVFHNTFYKFGAGLHRGGGIQHNRNYYLGNILIDMSHKFIEHKTRMDSTEYDSLAFKNNVFQGAPNSFGQLAKGERHFIDLSLPRWKSLLTEKKALADETGIVTEADVVINAGQHDFRLRDGSAAIGKGVKVFVPWALSRVVGEWHFYQTKTRPARVFGENINMNAEWVTRSMFHQIPRNDLTCPNSGPDDFKQGLLENWIPGSLHFNGHNQYCVLPNATLATGYKWKFNEYKKSGSGEIPASSRDTVDINEESFIIESVLSVRPDESHGGIINKRADKGYELLLDAEGHISVLLDTGGTTISRTSTSPLKDGQWHHIIVEVNRERSLGVNIYIDGALSNGAWSGPSRLAGSLSNSGDFEIGRSASRDYFAGQIDFLRISKDTLQMAGTTLEELREWQFNGPFSRDFTDALSSSPRRNAGAVEQTAEVSGR